MSPAENPLTPQPCVAVRAQLQREIEKLSHWHRAQLATLSYPNSDFARWFQQRLDALWEAATAPLLHDYLEGDQDREELLILDQCPIGEVL